MNDLRIKDIITFVEENKNKTKMIISDTSNEREIIFEGSGKIKTTVEV